MQSVGMRNVREQSSEGYVVCCAGFGASAVLYELGGRCGPAKVVGWVGDDVVCPMSKLWPVGRDRGMGMGETSDDVSLWFPKSFPSLYPDKQHPCPATEARVPMIDAPIPSILLAWCVCASAVVDCARRSIRVLGAQDKVVETIVVRQSEGGRVDWPVGAISMSGFETQLAKPRRKAEETSKGRGGEGCHI